MPIKYRDGAKSDDFSEEEYEDSEMNQQQQHRGRSRSVRRRGRGSASRRYDTRNKAIVQENANINLGEALKDIKVSVKAMEQNYNKNIKGVSGAAPAQVGGEGRDGIGGEGGANIPNVRVELLEEKVDGMAERFDKKFDDMKGAMIRIEKLMSTNLIRREAADICVASSVEVGGAVANEHISEDVLARFDLSHDRQNAFDDQIKSLSIIMMEIKTALEHVKETMANNNEGRVNQFVDIMREQQGQQQQQQHRAHPQQQQQRPQQQQYNGGYHDNQHLDYLRFGRTNNLIIFRLRKCEDNSNDQDIIDRADVGNILREIEQGDLINKIKDIVRLGKKDGGKIRPLKVVFLIVARIEKQ
ncbi:unnamed protein product [Meganyctiphanes norvegica]|uniref:Uncharacterized protein n=1 Tax=Meganyctiphanes norvegica TaxID=48144 RepID=A0AAV2SCP7_MEGNR